jgi:ABC-type antimicrobial peptide transport system permease subunit
VVNVYLGAHNISAPSEVNRKQYWGNETFIHPNWNRTTKAGDIALVKLSTVVEYTSKNKIKSNSKKNFKKSNGGNFDAEYIHPICLPDPSEPDYVNQYVTVTVLPGLQFDCKIHFNHYSIHIDLVTMIICFDTFQIMLRA